MTKGIKKEIYQDEDQEMTHQKFKTVGETVSHIEENEPMSTQKNK